MEWTTLPAQKKTTTQKAIQVSASQKNLTRFLYCGPPACLKHTRLVVQEADGAVLVRGDGDGLRRVADHTVDQLAACTVPVGKTISSQSCLRAGNFSFTLFSGKWWISSRGRTVLGLRLQRRGALLRVQVVEQRVAAVKRHHHLVGIGRHESH